MKRKPVFGKRLQDVFKDNHGNLPEVFTESIEILRQRGLTCKGLFCGRCEGRKAKLLEKAWDMGRNPLKAASFTDCYAVADSLLLWLKALTSPVIPSRLFRSFLGTQRTSCQAESLAELHLLFLQLEECELQLLEVLLGFLHDYRAAQPYTPGPSLGQMFAPALLRGSEGPLPLPFPEDVKSAARLVDRMVADYGVVFGHQTPSNSPSSHKPPSGAKRQKWSAGARQTDRHGRGGIARDLTCAGGTMQRFAANAPASPAAACTRELPVKHLRVNVVPPLSETEDLGSRDKLLRDGMPHPPLPCHPLASQQPPAREQQPRLAALPEGHTLTSLELQAEPELEAVFDILLCGSMENLFNDCHFSSEASAASSPRGISGSGGSGSEGDCAEGQSSDEDMLGGQEISPPNTPSRVAMHPSFQPHMRALRNPTPVSSV